MPHAQAIDRLKASLVPGQTYRRSELSTLSSNIDRHLAKLVSEGHLQKLAQGLYLVPKTTQFGEALPEEHSLLKTFLNDDHFVVYGPSQFNSLELGTTQLYNRRVVFNRKRVGEFTLGGRSYVFHRWREAPKALSPEFLVVELLNHLDQLAENREQVLARLREKLPQFNSRKLAYASSHFGTLSAQNRLAALTQPGS
jgi:hypothetical protein